ncbi:MAG TPA: hypothetical protein VFS88_07205 [Micavibrio sp.]|nr:hypothetical protein [Micavibrio sp.]
MHDIFAGFAENIDELSQKTKNHSKVEYIHGKAPYAGPIHLAVIGENLERHSMHLQTVSNTPSLQGGLYAGAAGFVNLSYMAAAKASAGLLFDINTYQTLFWNIVFDKVAKSSTPAAFRKNLSSIIPDIESAALRSFKEPLRETFRRNCDYANGALFKGLPAGELSHWIMTPSRPAGLWMHDPALYSHVRALVLNKAIGAITLDISSRKACDEVRKFLDGHDISVRTLYVSNILNFMQSPVRKTDFIGRDVLVDSRLRAEMNVYRWMEEDGRIIECDNLERGTPLLVAAKSFSHPSPAL